MACYLSALCRALIAALLMQQIIVVFSKPQVPCYFIFGDSLVDNGNNNGLVTMAKANYPPYGIDFPQGVSGRFTNGRTMADIIGQLLGFSMFIPSYATASDQEINTGVNYGSGGAGIRDETGRNLTLYRLGARKIAVYGLGCIESEEPQVPCYFIFGDSLVDSGNNNQLMTASKVNYPPYGIDFSEKASGRFTNGRTSADLIGEHLGFDEYIPTYVVATDEQINKGVNYASGSAGIREETGSHLGERISLNMQLLHHDSIISRLSNLQHDTTYINKCIYLVNIGSNDYINNYFFPEYYNTSRIYNPTQYAMNLIEQYSEQLMTLYNLGARKIVVFGLARIGCIPAEIGRFGTHGKLCVDSLNEAAKIFNNKLKCLVDELNNINSDGRFTFVNVTSISAPQG
nr:GDSL esterase/lipase At1g29670-like [Tanacetum cinerariifolium]